MEYDVSVDDVLSLVEAARQVAALAMEAGRTINQLAPSSSPQKNARTKKRISALRLTLDEWADIVSANFVNRGIQASSQALDARARELFTLYERLMAEEKRFERQKGRPKRLGVTIHLRHSMIRVSKTRGLELELGRSEETASLDGLVIPLGSTECGDMAEQRDLPVFKITMLGGKGCGKTVYMASMYTTLSLGCRGLSLRALDSQKDLELGVIVHNLFSSGQWPQGTEGNQIEYQFELRLHGRAVARVDWVDYKGGALIEPPDSPGGKALIQRLQDSQAILWMVDLSEVEQLGLRLDGMQARLRTFLNRMAFLSREAVAKSDQPRAWIFVRTKADELRDKNGVPDWERAVQGLLEHLGDAKNVALDGYWSRAAALSISSVGRVDKDAEGNTRLTDDPAFVEWPLLLSIALLMDAEFSRLSVEAGTLEGMVQAAQAGVGFWGNLFGGGLKPEQEEIQRRLQGLGRQLWEARANIFWLLDECPDSIKMIEPLRHDKP